MLTCGVYKVKVRRGKPLQAYRKGREGRRRKRRGRREVAGAERSLFLCGGGGASDNVVREW